MHDTQAAFTRYVGTREASRLIGLSPRTLEKDRCPSAVRSRMDPFPAKSQISIHGAGWHETATNPWIGHPEGYGRDSSGALEMIHAR